VTGQLVRCERCGIARVADGEHLLCLSCRVAVTPRADAPHNPPPAPVRRPTETLIEILTRTLAATPPAPPRSVLCATCGCLKGPFEPCPRCLLHAVQSPTPPPEHHKEVS